MLAYDWIVFDFTGTLMTPAPEPAVTYHTVGSSLGGSLTVDEVRMNLKAAIVKHFLGENVAKPTGPSIERARWRSIVQDCLTDIHPARVDQAFDHLWEHFSQAAHWRCFDDVPPTIERLKRAGYRIAIASNFDDRLKAILPEAGFESQFDQVLISSDLGWSKPNPKFYEAALERIGASAPDRVLMIGDTLQGDVIAAEQAGWHARHLIRHQPQALARLTEDLGVSR